MESAKPSEENQLEFLFNNLFLPPKLPRGHDGSGGKEAALVDLVLDSLRHFLNEADAEYEKAIKASISLMENLRASRECQGHLQATGVLKTLKRVASSGISLS